MRNLKVFIAYNGAAYHGFQRQDNAMTVQEAVENSIGKLLKIPASVIYGCSRTVPALCCDRGGLRLGYGRGYYDRFLAGFPGKSVVICYSDFVMKVPAEPHDMRADEIITE